MSRLLRQACAAPATLAGDPFRRSARYSDMIQSDHQPTPVSSSTAAVGFTPTRSAAQARLAVFLPSTGRRYTSERNVDYGPGSRSNVSVLSPYIRHRLILESEVTEAVLGRFALSTAEKFVQEVFWRTYFKGFLEQRPSIWADYIAAVDGLARHVSSEKPFGQTYNEAVHGHTGIDCFDSWAAELVETGYLHNHARMWFASIWIFTLKLPWQLGADFFYRHLMDGDPASNTLSWRWVAGLHTRGKTYLARPDNIAKYTDGRFNPQGELAKSAPPIEEDVRHEQVPIPALGPFPDSDYLLLITEEDCAPELLNLPRPPTAAIALLCTHERSPMPVGDRALTFATAAVADAVKRAGEAFSLAIDTPHNSTGNWFHELRDSAMQAGVSHIVTAYAAQGPVAAAIASARADLVDEGITLHQIRRPLDNIAWPHATRGYFGLKKKIPDILSRLAQTAQPELDL